jgi:hypothetical protein
LTIEPRSPLSIRHAGRVRTNLWDDWELKIELGAHCEIFTASVSEPKNGCVTVRGIFLWTPHPPGL